MATTAPLGLIVHFVIKVENVFIVKVMDGGWPMRKDAPIVMELGYAMNVMD